MNTTQTYIRTLLAPRLKQYGLNKAQREQVCADVAMRLDSLLAHWNDKLFRRTLLILGQEEAIFWEPQEASIEVRSLVVVGVRNSLIEALNAPSRNARQILPDKDMPLLTKEAIGYFQTVDFAHAAVVPGIDVFGSLPRRFPNAWQCLSALACMEGGEADYSFQKEKAEALAIASTRTRTAAHATTVVGNGMDPNIDPALANAMAMIQRGELEAFFAPSFSRLTRNPVKLLAILDHILRHGATLVTVNYLLSQAHVARRCPLLRPAHNIDEVEGNLANQEGLRQRHKELLSLALG